MARKTTKGDFYQRIKNQDIAITCNNVLLEIERYHGKNIHKIPKYIKDLRVYVFWIENGWAESSKNFKDMKVSHPTEFKSLFGRLYDAFIDEMFSI
jgi:hypothetical protein